MPKDRIPPNQQLVGKDRWPLVGEREPRADASPWTLSVLGLVEAERTWAVSDLANMPLTTRSLDIHCVTRWSKLDVEFRGILLGDLLALAVPAVEARFVSFVARTDRQHSTSLPLNEALDLQSLVALEADGEPLSSEHGGPIRMVVPGKYFYKSVKWLERIELLAEDRLGYWESDAGYHNGADPWLEQRYMAPAISKQHAAKLITSRDFAGQDLRSIDASKRQLDGLVAQGAMLRDANFTGASLTKSDFSQANLSNAHFVGAKLHNANLAGADIEGANFTDADLRGADFRVASMFGASFCEFTATGDPQRGARIDVTTRIEKTKLDALTPDQKNYVIEQLSQDSADQ